MRILVVFFLVIVANAYGQEKADSICHNYEHIVHFHSDIKIQSNNHVLIHERIKVVVLGQSIQRGIYRDIPLWYNLKNGGTYRVDFELLDLKRDGKAENHKTEWLDNGIRIYAGEEDVLLPSGVYTYDFVYEVSWVLLYGERNDELVWNVNGNGWDFYIDSLSASVHLPKGAKALKYTGYVGGYGNTSQDCFNEYDSTGVVHFAANGMMKPAEGLTVAVAFDKNHVTYPTAFDEFMFNLKVHAMTVIGLFGIGLGLIMSLLLWFLYGRDPKPGTIIPRFYAPEGFSSAECAYLKRAGRKSDMMMSSILVSFATKGLVTIAYSKSGSKDVYTVSLTDLQVKDAKEPLTDIERQVFDRLFKSRTQLTIKEGKYNSLLAKTDDLLEQWIDEKQEGVYYVRNRHLARRLFVIPVLMIIAAILTYAIIGGLVMVVIICIVVQIALNLLFRYLLEQPTAKGREKMDEIAGLEMYIKYANQDRIKAMNPPTFDFHHFEENLPYAVALGLADDWTDAFKYVKTEIEHDSFMFPAYFIGMSHLGLGSFSHSMSDTISSASTPPSSSGSGGSFSGGGGFSGGGFGGGGGGGW